TRVPSYGYGKYRNVITALELAEMIRNDRTIIRPSDSTPAKSITFVTCVGSRDKRTNEYCSSFCCTYTVHFAKILKEQDKNIDVTIMYIDMRTFSNYEYLFREARALGVKFLRGKPSLVFEKADNQQLTVQLENTITREFLHYKTDIVVLSIGAEPAAGIDDLGEVLGITRDEKTGFFKVSEEDDVSAVGQERVFIAGNASGPKDTQYSLAQASAAAMKALISIGGLQ
ncbi:MAG: disulfide reductase, partial [Candidatus Hodarchaeales archaeon]